MASIYQPTYTKTDAATGRKVKRKTRKWYIEYRDADGRVQKVPGYADLPATRQLAADLERRAVRLQSGLADPFEEHRKRSLADHLADFRRYLEAKGNTEKHARQTCNRVQAVLDGCRFQRIPDLSPSAVVEWLAAERHANRIGVQTSNYYLRDTKAFCRWLVRDRRAGENPLAHLSGMNAKADVRLERRALPADEFAAFVAAARQGSTMRGLSGQDRAMLYTVAAYTGLREAELASLTPESFDLRLDTP